VVGQNCSLENGTVIGPRVHIGNNSTIHSNVKIWPDLTIKSASIIQENILNPDYG